MTPPDAQPLTLVDFLLARLAEDEAVAQAARQYEYLSAARDASSLRWGCDSQGYGTIFANSGRVLAEVAAKRRIMELHGPIDPCDAHDASFRSIPCDTLRTLAQPYSDHPDFREEWGDSI